MRKLIPLVLLAACGAQECPEYDIRPVGLVGGVEAYELRINVLPNETGGMSQRDVMAINDSQTCPRDFQDIKVQYEPDAGAGLMHKIITFYCL